MSAKRFAGEAFMRIQPSFLNGFPLAPADRWFHPRDPSKGNQRLHLQEGETAKRSRISGPLPFLRLILSDACRCMQIISESGAEMNRVCPFQQLGEEFPVSPAVKRRQK